MSTQSLDRHIVNAPGVGGGQPRIAGRRISVADVAEWHERMGKSVDEICAEHDLTLAQAHAALAYYFDHKTEMDARLASDEAFAEQMRAETPSLLQEKLKALRGG